MATDDRAFFQRDRQRAWVPLRTEPTTVYGFRSDGAIACSYPDDTGIAPTVARLVLMVGLNPVLLGEWPSVNNPAHATAGLCGHLAN